MAAVASPVAVATAMDGGRPHGTTVSGAGLPLGKPTPQGQQELSELLRDRLVSLGRRVPGPRKARVNGSADEPSAG
ncbi:hypothetical protein [Streptomyces sp. ME19-01-6]|uniref:hypothetical protein n=1 Tax=Streptomyces sp. ME19-01-6 TaxID=3028686 RepID=UPI0029A444DB|nr:hypothetical protein [Streptomyces sp. ME19-01-6]MDX3225368.1 hypothetical protein [Streptomyces sp. ME19-01-6]